MPETRKVVRSKKNKKKKKSGKVWKILLTIFLILVLGIASYLTYLYYVSKNAADKAYDNSNRVKSDLREEKVEPLTDNISILFVGVDDSEKRSQGSSNSRSDSLMLATLNNKEKSVKLLSIPRDSYVYIPAFNKQDKITHAHTDSSGVYSSIETVEKLLNVPVDYYFELNFDSFIQVVDALDGIEVDVPYDLDEIDENDKKTIHLKKGVQTLNGSEALALARTRHYDDDFKRGERQQMILQAIVEKATSVSSFTKYDSLLTAMGDNMTTNMPFNEMASFFNYLKDGMPKITSEKLEGTDDMSTGIYYFKLNEASVSEVSATLRHQLGLDTDTSTGTDSSTDNSTNDNSSDTTEDSSTEDDSSYSNFSGQSNNGEDYSNETFTNDDE